MVLVPTPAKIEYMREHISDSKVDELIAATVIGLCIAPVAVCLRFKPRRLLQAKVNTDDCVGNQEMGVELMNI